MPLQKEVFIFYYLSTLSSDAVVIFVKKVAYVENNLYFDVSAI